MEKSDVDFILSNLWKCVLPDEHCALQLLKMGADVMSQEPNVLDLKTPITVCGDLHGQFYDVLELFSVGGKPPEQNFIFLGDYVDRGYYSTETLFLLLCLKVRFPTKIYLLRGNHETQAITEQYGFYEEVRKKYPSSDIYNKCLEVFQMMPLAALIDNKVFCIHGGLSPSLTDIKEIEELDRKQEAPIVGLFADILWSDPDDVEGFIESRRGAGYCFGGDVTNKFLRSNNLNYICRAHQVSNQGYEEWFGGSLYTVWSAPNYCYRSGNKASILEIYSTKHKRFKIFREAPAYARGNIPESKIPQYFS